jgi:hypothetical protein
MILPPPEVHTQIFRRIIPMALSRQVLISSQNEGPIVNISAWLGMTFTVLCVCTRLVSKYSVIRRLTIDDALIGGTMVSYSCSICPCHVTLTIQGLAAAHTYALSMMVTNGLGRPEQTLDDGMIEDFEKVVFPHIEERVDTKYSWIVWLCLAVTLHSSVVSCKALHLDLPQCFIPRHSVRSPQYCH